MEILVTRADKDGSTQCSRCWRYEGVSCNFMGVCDRCTNVLIARNVEGNYLYPQFAYDARKYQLEQLFMFSDELRHIGIEERNTKIEQRLIEEGLL